MKVRIPTKDVVVDLLHNQFTEQSVMNEAKSYDRAHGEKLPHALIDQFFKDQAPKYDSLAAVEMALHTLYKKNNIETTTQGVKQVISNYKKKVALAQTKKVQESFEEILNEVSLTGAETKKKEEIVKAMKKHYKEFKRKYKDDAKAVMYATATKMAQDAV